jgi:hypothetical protein
VATELNRTTNLAWRRFLLTDAGIQGMLYLRECAPSIGRGEASGMIFDAGRSQGFNDCLNKISEVIAADVPKNENLEN